MNDVEVCHPGAAVDLFIGATNMSENCLSNMAEDRHTGFGCGKRSRTKSHCMRTDCYREPRLKQL
jgi:hypothetical protein